MLPGCVQDASSEVIGANHNGAADLEVEEDGGEEVIGHRENPEHSVLVGQAQSLVGGARSFQDSLMGQNHAFSRAGRARSKPQKGSAGDPGRQRDLSHGHPRKTQRNAVRCF